MDLRTRILEDDQATQANAGQVQPNPEALATIGKAIAGLAMKAHFNDLNAFLKEFKGTEVFQTLLKNNPEAAGSQGFEEIMKSNYSREERQKIVEEYIQSGKSQTVFAPEYGIKPNTLSAWVTEYKSEESRQA